MGLWAARTPDPPISAPPQYPTRPKALTDVLCLAGAVITCHAYSSSTLPLALPLSSSFLIHRFLRLSCRAADERGMTHVHDWLVQDI